MNINTPIKPHYIKDNRNTAIPKRLVMFDVETSFKEVKKGEYEHKFKLATAVHQRLRKDVKNPQIEWLETFSSHTLCNWILSKSAPRERLYVMSANIWFDMRVSGILNLLRKEHWINRRLYVNGLTLIIVFSKITAGKNADETITLKEYKRGKTFVERSIVFLNIQNYFRVSVKQLGKDFDLPKVDVNFNKVSDKKLMTYCRRDTEIIFKAINTLCSFIKDNQLGNFGYTFPSIAFNIYRHKFMKHKLLVHKNFTVTKLERASYFGGRTECFKIGKFRNKKLLYIDINSMYPFVMYDFKYPTIFKYYTENVPLEVAETLLDSMCIVAEVDIQTNEPVYPTRINHRCVYPIGRFKAFLNTGSFKYALRHNHILKVNKMACFKKEYIFRSYVEYFYNLRLAFGVSSQVAFENLCKGFLNSLYGKFGQKGDRVIEDIECDYDQISRQIYFNYDKQTHLITTKFFGREVTIERSVEEGTNSIVSIASHVTDYARMYLWSFIKVLGRDGVYYMDTDSLIIDANKTDTTWLPLDETKLGYFKIEKRASSITIHGLKDYEFAGKTKIKGITKKAKLVNPNTYEQLYFPGIYSELREGLDKPYKTYDRSKTLKREYKKGIVLPNGDVKPFELDEV